MRHICEEYPELAADVKQAHERAGLRSHHDYPHVVRVGETAKRIALDEWNDENIARQAGIAGLTHSADHILRKRYNIRPPHTVRSNLIDELLEQQVRPYLGVGAFERVKHAVHHHDKKK